MIARVPRTLSGRSDPGLQNRSGWIAGVRVVLSGLCVSVCVACAASSAAAPDARAIRDSEDTGSKVLPLNAAEHQILEQLNGLPPNQRRAVGSATVAAGEGYDAASGRFCRIVTFTTSAAQKPVTRLACRDKREWFFVPDVLAASGP